MCKYTYTFWHQFSFESKEEDRIPDGCVTVWSNNKKSSRRQSKLNDENVYKCFTTFQDSVTKKPETFWQVKAIVLRSP